MRTSTARSMPASVDVQVGDQAGGARAEHRRPARPRAGGGRRASRPAACLVQVQRHDVGLDDGGVEHAERGDRLGQPGRACSWSSASRSTWWSSAYRPAAARMPAWRMPPPSRLRHSRAVAIRSAAADAAASRPARRGPWTGRPTRCRRARRRWPGHAGGDGACQIRAPSQCRATPASRRPVPQLLQLVERLHRAAAPVVRLLDGDRRGGGQVPVALRPHLGDQLRRRPAGRPRRPGAGGDAEDRGRRADLVGDHVRVGVAEQLLARPQTSCRPIWLPIDPRRHEQRRLVPEQRGDPLLERVDRRVLAVDVVADLGLGHRLAHRRRSAG